MQSSGNSWMVEFKIHLGRSLIFVLKRQIAKMFNTFPLWGSLFLIRFMRQIPDCPPGISIHGIVLISSKWKNKVCIIICMNFEQFYSTVLNTIEFHGIQYHGKNFNQNWHKLLGKLMKWKQYRTNFIINQNHMWWHFINCFGADCWSNPTIVSRGSSILCNFLLLHTYVVKLLLSWNTL